MPQPPFQNHSGVGAAEWRGTRRGSRTEVSSGHRRPLASARRPRSYPWLPVPSDPVELLDRQHQRLQSQEGPEFIHELRRFYEFITAGPNLVVAALAERRADAERIEREFAEHDEQLVPELMTVRAELVALVPEADDSDLRPRRGFHAPSMTWAFSLANFDEVASGGADASLMPQQEFDRSRSSMLLRILQNRFRTLQWMQPAQTPHGSPQPTETNQRPQLDDLARRLRNLDDRHRHAAQAFTNAVNTHGGFQVVYLDMAIAEMNPEPTVIETDDDQHAWMNEMFKRVAGGWHVIETAAAGRSLDSRARETLNSLVARLKPPAERVYEDLRMKLAITPEPAVRRPDYGERLKAWTLSPGYQLLGGPCIGGVITQAVMGQSKGLVLFLVLTVLALLIPPALRSLPAISYTRTNIAFIAGASVAVIVATAAGGVGIGLLVFALVVLAFLAGRYSWE
jgi:hypothetical protein